MITLLKTDQNMATKYAVLESIPFFNVLDKDEMAALANHMELHTAPKYAHIFSEGDPADFFYILSEGSVKIGTHHDDGREVIKQVLHPRMVFGELALIQHHMPHHNFATSLSSHTAYYKIAVEGFRQIMDKNPQLTMSVV